MNSILLWLGLSLACTVALLVVLYVVLRNTGEECKPRELYSANKTCTICGEKIKCDIKIIDKQYIKKTTGCGCSLNMEIIPHCYLPFFVVVDDE